MSAGEMADGGTQGWARRQGGSRPPTAGGPAGQRAGGSPPPVLTTPDALRVSFGGEPDVTLSAGRDRPTVAHWRHPPGTAEALPFPDAILVLSLGDTVQKRHSAGRTDDVSRSRGQVGLIGAGPQGVWEIVTEADLLHLYLTADYLRHAARQHGLDPRGAVDLRESLAFDDPFLTEGMLELHRVLPLGAAASMFTSTMGLALTLRVLRLAGSVSLPCSQPARGGLAPHLLRRAKDVIDAGLVDGLTLGDVAAEVGLSAKHFARAFRESTGIPPHQWLMERRVARAKDMLASGALPLAEVALACGFADQSHFTHCFRQATGATPGHWRRDARYPWRQPEAVAVEQGE